MKTGKAQPKKLSVKMAGLSAPPKFNPMEQALQAIKDPANTFKYYDNKTDVEHFLHLSSQFIEYLYKHGYLLIEKIGQGGYNAAYTAKSLNTDETVVLLLPGFNSSDNDKIPQQAQKFIAKEYPDIPYDPKKIKITDDQIYLTESEILYIPVLEKADHTVAELFYRHRFDSIHDKHQIITKLQNDFAIAVKILIDNKLSYSDLLLDNLAYIGDHLVLIDLENLSPIKNDKDAIKLQEMLNELNSLIFTEFDEESIAYAEKTKSWKHVAAFFNNAKELNEYKSFYD